LAKFRLAGFGLVMRGRGFGGFCACSECILYAMVTPGNRDGFERGFLGIVKAFFVIG